MARIRIGRFLALLLLPCCALATAAPCVPGSLSDYIALGAAGCDSGSVQHAAFASMPTRTPGATAIDPALVQITPSGGADDSELRVAGYPAAEYGELLQSIFRFESTGAFVSASFDPQLVARGLGLVTAQVFVCADGHYGADPADGCDGTSVFEWLVQTEDSWIHGGGLGHLPAASFFDVVLEVTLDVRGGDGSASVASIGLAMQTLVPEPGTFGLWLAAIGLWLPLRRRLGSAARC